MDTKEKQGGRKRPSSGAQSASKGNSPHRRTPPKPGSHAEAQAPKTPRPSSRRRTQTHPKPETHTAPDVVYTPALPFSRSRMLLRLATVTAVVLALIFGVSIFFKVDTVTVSGAEKYTPYMIQEASGIREGDNLLTLDKVRASGKIIAALPYVDTVRIAIQLPDTVHIEITEMDVVYSVKDAVGAWWLMTSDGRVVVKTDEATAGSYTQILGVALESPEAGQQARAATQTLTLEDGTTQPMPEDSRLSTVLSILQYLEGESIIGQIVSVDVTNLQSLELWYGQQYQVLLGDTTQLGYKIQCMKNAIAGLDDYQQGILDVSFTRYPDQVPFRQFS